MSETVIHPLACPRCGCQDSQVIETRRLTREKDPQPLPGIRRRRICSHCSKQFYTRETIEEIGLVSGVWRIFDLVARATIDCEALPAGEYPGWWTQHEVDVEIDGIPYRLGTRNQMRCERYPCTVIVSRSGVTVESLRADGR